MKEKFLLRVKYKIIAIMMMAITIRRVDLSTKRRRLTKSDKSNFILIILIRKEQVIRVIIGKSFDNFL
jgi:hypothetical protein